MICRKCGTGCRKYGTRRGLQRYQCSGCRTLYTERARIPDNLYARAEDGLLAPRMLLGGNSVGPTERLTYLHRDTILSLLVLAGQKCENTFARLVVNVPVQDVQCDELWAFVFKKEAHKYAEEARNDSGRFYVERLRAATAPQPSS